MGTFGDLFSNLDPDPRVRGKQFEHVCKWFLANDPTYKNTLRRVWLWSEWTGRWGADAGIDLVAQDHDGRLWAVQCKAYAPENSVTKADVDKFLAESSRAVFSYRLLIATTDKRHPIARRTMDDQEKKVGFVGLSDLLTSEADWHANPRDLRPTKPPRPATPRDYQREAIRDVIKGFESAERGQLIMACGTGKTLTSLFIKEKLDAERTLVLLPSLSLLKQTMQVWRAHAKVPFEALPVCSDQTVSQSEDEAVVHTSELGVPVTTDPTEIAAFLRRRSGPRVVFSTYQSSPQLGAAFALGRVPQFDIAFADEAHRVAGDESAVFATILNADSIKVRRRLFMTATPRYYTGRVLKAAQDEDLAVATMNDPAKFGTVFHRLTFGEAIRRKLLTDYRVAVIGVDDATYREWAEKGTLVKRDGKPTDARELASQIGLAKAMWKYDLRRVISFHSRVSRARRFASDLPEVVAWMPPRQRPEGALWTSYASGEMTAGERHVRLQRLRQLDAGERGLLTNARCLSEGVDVPTLDGVAFIDPRRSEVDIVQAVGRAIRNADNKKVGTVVIPVFIDTDTDPEDALSSSVFEPVWDVIRALRSHDEELGRQLDELRRELGRRGGKALLPNKIHVDIPKSVDTAFSDAFDVRLVAQTTTSWEFWFGMLEHYAAENGHPLVAQTYAVNQYPLGRWVSKQRANRAKGNLDSDREHRLESLPGWTWEPKADRWEHGFSHLLGYVQVHGHACVPMAYTVDDYALGRWVIKQRARYAEDALGGDRQSRLQHLPGWTWDTTAAKWEEGFRRLVAYVEDNGHARVPPKFIADDGYKLGLWVANQRSKQTNGTLDADRQSRLQDVPGWTWDPFAEKWEEGFRRLLEYIRSHGHTNVPAKETFEGYRLGQWTTVQRQGYRGGQLDKERQQRLQEIPEWTWAPIFGQWENGFQHLEQFVAAEGHSRVPQTYAAPDSFRLGSWVNTQRARHSDQKLDPARAELLAELPGWAWKPSEAKWETGFQHLQEFARTHGNVSVPTDYEIDGFKLRDWLANNRAKFDKLDPERQYRLKNLPGWDDYSHDMKWEKAYQYLLAYVKQHGDARVERAYVVDDYPLGTWAMTQRLEFKKGRLATQRVKLLSALPGWDWDRSANKWEDGYSRLVKYIKQKGSTPPGSHVDDDGYRLGAWTNQQRQLGRSGKLTQDRLVRLNRLKGWDWYPPRGAAARRT